MTGIEDLLDLEGGAGEVHGLADHELDVVAGGGFDHVVALFEAERHRFFDEDMLAGVAGVDGETVVQLVAQHDSHGVDLVIGQEIGVRGVALGNVVFVHVLAALLFEEIGDRDDLDVIEGGDGITVGGGNAAQSDDSDFQFGHVWLTLLCSVTNVRQYQQRCQFIIPVWTFSLDHAAGDALDDLALEDQGDDEDRDGREDGHGGHVAPGDIELAARSDHLGFGESHGDDFETGAAGEDERREELVPADDEVDEEHGGDAGADYGQDDAPEELEEAGAVNFGGILNLDGHLAQK